MINHEEEPWRSKMSKSVQLDSRSFIRIINESAQANIKQFEHRIEYMGKEVNRRWKLSALHQGNLYFEDIDSNKYYVADYNKNNGKVIINNIKPIEVVENKKREMFSESCLRLINAIEANSQKDMASAFNTMKAQRFSPKIIPNSGNIMGKDGVVRRINVTTGSVSEETIKKEIVRLVVESMTNRVVVCEDKSVIGEFNDGEKIKLPLTEWGKRKLVARKMRDYAENAYWSEGFQNRIHEIACLVSEEKIEEAVNKIKPFLVEMEEFTLLNRKKTQTLVENALASKAIFNQQLCDDVATLFYKTNLKVNKPKILKEWKNIGIKTSNTALVENVSLLAESQDFEHSYEKFLHIVFENISNRDVTASALATTLESLKERTPKIKESYDLSSKLTRLVQRLKEPNFDDSAIYEAQDLIATIQEELSANDSLSQFDSMPGDDQSDMADITGGSGSGAPVININSPLIQIGGKSGAKDDAEDSMSAEFPDDSLDDQGLDMGAGAQPPAAPPADLGGAQDPMGGMGGMGGAPQGGQPPAGGPQKRPPFPMESKSKKSIKEGSQPIHYEMNGVSGYTDDDMPRDEEADEVASESSDPYRYFGSKLNSVLKDYGSPVIRDYKTVEECSSLMAQIADKRKISGEKLSASLPTLAEAVMKSLKINIPETKKNKAISQLVENFEQNYAFLLESELPDFIKDKMKDEDSDSGSDSGLDTESDSDSDEEGFAEDQYKLPKMKKRGLKRSSINKNKDTATESVKWLERQEDAVLGEMNGIRFVLDHGTPGSNIEPAILSEDNTVEVPIPKALVNSAYASAKLRPGNGTAFNEWLSKNLVQLQPINEDDDNFDEILATIKRGSDGGVYVDIGGSEDVDNGLDQPEMGMSGLDEVSVDDADSMEDDAIGDDDMPDFESDDSEELDDLEGDSEESNEFEDDESEDEESDESDEFEEESDDDESDDEESDDDESEYEDLDSEDDDEFEEVDEIEFESPEDAMCEDDELTSPEHAKYTKHVNDNKRDVPSPKTPKKTDDELDGFENNKKLDTYDGTGDKSVASKKLSD